MGGRLGPRGWNCRRDGAGWEGSHTCGAGAGNGRSDGCRAQCNKRDRRAHYATWHGLAVTRRHPLATWRRDAFPVVRARHRHRRCHRPIHHLHLTRIGRCKARVHRAFRVHLACAAQPRQRERDQRGIGHDSEGSAKCLHVIQVKNDIAKLAALSGNRRKLESGNPLHVVRSPAPCRRDDRNFIRRNP